jgi:hypothetical protein
MDGRLLWLLHMGILAFWLYDRSEKHALTNNLLRAVSTLLNWSAALKMVPGFQNISTQLTESLLALL